MSNAELEDGGPMRASAPTSLVERLRGGAEFIENLCLQKAPADGFAETMREAADAIEELRRSEAVALEYGADEHNRRLALEQRYRWISVEERLPEMHKDVWIDGEEVEPFFVSDPVLVAYNLDEMGVAVYEEDDVFKGWLLPWDGSVLHTVTHWRPLPEPPEDDERCSSLRDEEDGGRMKSAPTEEAENGEE